MRCICGYVGKEWLVFIFLNPAKSLSEKNICTETFCLDEFPIMANDRILVFIFWRISTAAVISLTYSSGTVDKDLIKTTGLRLIFFFITKVPFTENS